MVDARLGVGRETQPPRVEIAPDHGVEPRLMDRDLASLEHVDLARVHIDADHGVAGIRQASAGNEAHVTCAIDRNSHT